ncbi:hypothetical protein HMPREF9073_02868 [Capnocytophaga sp. oral taxon 326 str. F0382]|nr:hypothetical protein HMPREF9073_02868 [Capnocytophaga sp. oral taxon 326 str. F0382]
MLCVFSQSKTISLTHFVLSIGDSFILKKVVHIIITTNKGVTFR